MIEFRKKKCFIHPFPFIAVSSLPDAGAMYVSSWHFWGFRQFPLSLSSLLDLSTLKREEYTAGRLLALDDFASHFIFLQFLSLHPFLRSCFPTPTVPPQGYAPLCFYTTLCPASSQFPHPNSLPVSVHIRALFSSCKCITSPQELVVALCLRFIA